MSERNAIQQLLAGLAPEQAAAIRAAVARGIEALRKPEELSLAKWAHRHFYLSAESSQREEKWEAWPFQLGLLECMGSDSVEELTFFKSARLGATKCLLADICYTAQHQRRNQGVWQPTDGDSDDFCKTDLDTALRDVQIMRTVFPQVLAKSKANTMQQKKFLGSILKLRGGNSSGNYRRLTLAKARADELDGFDHSIDKAGTPDSLIRKRVEGATYPKCIWASTGRKKGLSHIERCYNASDIQMRFRITCPHCDVEHPLEWGGKKSAHGMKWDMDDPLATIRHVCPHCRGSIVQADYIRLARAGAWVSECGNYRLIHGWDDKGEPWTRWTSADGSPCLPPKRVGMHCWTAYSPQVTWSKILEEFLDALKEQKAGNPESMVQWVNETKGETFEEKADKADVNALQTRAKGSGYLVGQVPVGGLILVASVDVQDNRFEIVVKAVGRGEEIWVIDYIVMDANPAVMADWDRLWERLRLPYRHVHGAWLTISGAAVDTGYGNFTHQAYFFVNKYADRDSNFRLYAVKGSSSDGDPIKARSAKWMTINHKGRTIKRGVKLWMVGTDTAKDLFYGRIKVTQPGPGYIHFAADLPTAFFVQYGNEKRMKVRVAGRDAMRWVHFTGANEVVDCTVYNLFVIEALEIAKFSDRRWQQLESQVAPDLFDMADAMPPNQILAGSIEPAQLPAPAAAPAPAPIEPQKPQPAARKPASAPPTPTMPGLGSDSWRGRL